MATVSKTYVFTHPQGQFWLWLVGFLAVSVTSEQAAYPRLVSLALAMQFGAKAVTIMFQVIIHYVLFVITCSRIEMTPFLSENIL